MKKYFLIIALFTLVTINSAFAQSYKLTHFQLTVNSVPRSYDGPTITVGDTFLSTITETKNGDSSEFKIEKERIIKNKKGYYIKTAIANGANNYYIELSDIKAEKKAGIYDITIEAAYNNGTVKTLFFKGKKLEQAAIE